jgi:hypothetical protein
MVTPVSEHMPAGIKWALAGVWFQIVSNLLAGVFLLSVVNDAVDHGQDVPNLGLVRLSVYVAFLAGAALLLCAVCAGKRFRWVRGTILWVECLYVLVLLVNVFVSGVYTQVIGLFISLTVSRTMLSVPGRDWFSR